MRLVQFLPTLAMGDAVGNDTLALQRAIQELGYSTQIFAETVDPRFPKGTAEVLHGALPKLEPEDVILYHNSIGSSLNRLLPQYPNRKIMIYHNITPPHFFTAYSMAMASDAQYGLDGLKQLVGKVDLCLADSAFNRAELQRMGYTCPIMVRPILIPFEDYAQKPDRKILRKYQDDWTNLIFVGRIAPNKKQQDVLAAFAAYQKHCNPKSRLILVGNDSGMERYSHRLHAYAERLGIQKDVVFTGYVRFSELLAYYQIADVFLCMSEHEGFCVPLAEAMYFNIPIIAYESSAIPWTLGDSGLLVRTKQPLELALLIDRVVRDKTLRNKLIAGQRQRLEDFSYANVKALFAQQLAQFLARETIA